MLDNYCKKLLSSRALLNCKEVIEFFKTDVDDTKEFVYETLPKFPKTQEVTDITIPKFRKMTDHILYTIEVTNSNIKSNWIVLKRYTQFFNMDNKCRENLEKQGVKLPERPHRKAKVMFDHMSSFFIERRRVLMQNYLRKVLLIPQYAHHVDFLEFLGV